MGAWLEMDGVITWSNVRFALACGAYMRRHEYHLERAYGSLHNRDEDAASA